MRKFSKEIYKKNSSLKRKKEGVKEKKTEGGTHD